MLIGTIKKHAAASRMAIALQGSDTALSYYDLVEEISQLQAQFKQNQPRTLAIAMQNHPAWVMADLAAMASQIACVPLPLFFSDAQLLHAIQDAGADTLITDNPQRFSTLLGNAVINVSTQQIAGKTFTQFQLNTPCKILAKNTAKITYTSGTTGNPKGVCLSNTAMLCVASSIKTAATLSPSDQHLCVLPLSTLLENVAGVYATLLAGATAHVLPAEVIGLSGSSLDAQSLISALMQTQASTAIFIPELLNALVLALEAGATPLPHLRFLAVGGAHVSPALLLRAKKQNIPVFEGYGLSESASVVALNSAKQHRIGSVGKPLPHIAIQFSERNEILVKGANLLSYTGEQSAETPDNFIATGDIGYLDNDGFLFINGRKKNIFITSFGRNVSPEWVERELTSQAEIGQACLFGEAKPWNVALIVTKPQANIHALAGAIELINKNLPDYARVTKWLQVAPFTLQNNQLTSNGRLKRDVIWQHYQHKINALYKDGT